MSILQDEAELEEIVKLVGMDALSALDRLKLETARTVREDFLHQNAFHETDTYTPLTKQFLLMKLISEFYHLSMDGLKDGIDIEKIVTMSVRERIGRFKYTQNDKVEKEFNEIMEMINSEIEKLRIKEVY